MKNKFFIPLLLMAVTAVPDVFGETLSYSGAGIVIEAENYITDSTKWNIIDDESASGGKAAAAKNNNFDFANTESEIGFEFSLGSDDTYNIWARIKAVDTTSDSVYISYDGGEYQSKFFSWEDDYYWIRLDRVELEEGSHSVDIISRERNFVIDEMIVTSRAAYLPDGICESVPESGGEELISKYEAPPVTPPANTHPRVYFTDVDKVKLNLEAEENAYAKSELESDVKAKVSPTSYYSDTILAVIESKAFYYAINGEAAYDTGREAIEAVSVIADMSVGNSAITRRYGRMINVLAEVYDWCYNILEEEEKKEIIELCAVFASEMEIGWPPSQQGAVVGHGSEAQLLRDLMSFAIAVYDERPDVWNYIGGRFYEEYVPVREFTNKGFYNHQGTNYGYYRHQYDSYAYALITGMGCDEPYSGEDLYKASYSQLYMRRPDGNIFADGDMYTDRIPAFDYIKPESAGLLLDYAIGNDPYIKNEYYRQTVKVENGKIVQSFPDSSPVLYLIVNNPEIETKLIYNMPLAMYYPSPVGMMIARTGWQDGIKSPVVAAMMKIGEYQFNNHQHLDAGSFQIYYKGMLASESGEYTSYGTLHHNMYTSKSIAHNTMLVYDPGEDKNTEDRSNINDGGQKAVNGYSEFGTLDEMLGGGAKVSEVMAQEIDPKNPNKPSYTYIKGDLTNAYSDKISDFKRSFMFLNTENQDVPGVMVVFDKVNSKNKEFKKIWLMHGQTEPSVSQNKSVFNITDNGYNGKMTIDTLLPSEQNTEFNIEGGEDNGWSVVNRYTFLNDSWQKTKIADYTAEDTSADSEANTYRLEISPKTAAEQDYFLNVIQVSDGDCENYLSAGLVENDLFYGADIDGKIILFSKSGNETSADFTFASTGENEYLICDMESGRYRITDESGTQYADASDDGGVLSFSASGDITVTRMGDAVIEQAQKTDTEIDTAYIKYGGSYLYSAVNPMRVNDSDDFLVPVSLFDDNTGVRAEKIDGGVKLYNSETDEFLAQVTEGNDISTNLGVKECSVKPYTDEESGELLVSIGDIAGVLNLQVIYDEYSKTLFLEDSGSKEVYINYMPTSDSTILINVFDKSNYTADYIAAAYNGSKLLSVAMLSRADGGMYSGEMADSEDITDVKMFKWNKETLIPLRKVTQASAVNKSITVRRPTKYNMTGGGMEKEILENNKYRFTKTTTNAESQAFVNGIGYHSVGHAYSYKWVHYSSMLEIEKRNGANSQVRVRNYSGSGMCIIFNRALAEGRYKIDIIFDLLGMKAYTYINGELDTTTDISKLKDEGYSQSRFSRVEHYFTGSTLTGSALTLQGMFSSTYGEDVLLSEIESGIRNGIF